MFSNFKPNDCSVGKIEAVANNLFRSSTGNFLLIVLFSPDLIRICFGAYITNIVPLSLIFVGFCI